MIYRILLLSLFVQGTQLIYGQWAQNGSTLNGIEENKWFGYSTSLSTDGNILAVGTPYLNGDGVVNTYKNIGGNWVPLGSDIIGGVLEEKFGASVSLNSDGSILAIGASGLSQQNDGHVSVFTFDGTSWNLLGSSIDALQDGSDNDNFGESVSLSADGNILAVGATNGVFYSGYTNVFTYDGSDWIQLGSTIHGVDNASSGFSVSLSDNGHTLAIGTPHTELGGVVRVYKYINSDWVQTGADISMSNAMGHPEFGISVSLNSDGSILATSGIVHSPNGNDISTVRQVYEYTGNEWTQLGADIIHDSFNNLGCNVSLSSNGHTLAFTGSNTLQGEPMIGVHNYNGSNWVPLGDEITGDLGGTVSLSGDGNRVVSGNYKINNYTGHVSVFDYSENIGIPEEEGYNIYPNPVTNLLNLELTDKATYKLHSVLGKDIIQSGSLSTGKQVLDLSDLKKGVYLLQIISEQDITSTKKIIKQ